MSLSVFYDGLLFPNSWSIIALDLMKFNSQKLTDLVYQMTSILFPSEKMKEIVLYGMLHYFHFARMQLEPSRLNGKFKKYDIK